MVPVQVMREDLTDIESLLHHGAGLNDVNR